LKTYNVKWVIALPDEMVKPPEIMESISDAANEGWKLVTASDSMILHKGKEINRVLLYFEKD